MNYICVTCKKSFAGKPYNGESWVGYWCSIECQIAFEKTRERADQKRKGSTMQQSIEAIMTSVRVAVEAIESEDDKVTFLEDLAEEINELADEIADGDGEEIVNEAGESIVDREDTE